MLTFFRSQAFRLTFVSIILLEILSFIAWARPPLGNVFILLIFFIALILSLKDLRYGVALMVAELCIGSHGYLFSYGAGDLALSLRLGLFLVLMTAFCFTVYKQKQVVIWSSNYFKWFVALALAIVFSFLWGMKQGNGFANVFFDGNAFIFFALAFPFWQAIRTSDDWFFLLRVGWAALLASSIKVIFLLYAFSHQLWWMLPETYKWVRDTRVGEITQVTETFFRIFFASQIYTVMAMFFLTFIFFSYWQKEPLRKRLKQKAFWFYLIGGGLMFASFLISFSRSNWLGGFVAFVFILVWIVLTQQTKAALMRAYLSNWILFGLTSLVLITVTVLFPFPSSSGEFAAGSLFSNRAFRLSGEAGLSSRWQLLTPLWGAVKAQPILGAGFGKEVTYYSDDPRIRAINSTGEYTTFVFEWGYLDLWLKLGFIGFSLYALFALKLLKESFLRLRAIRLSVLTWQEALSVTFFFTAITFFIVHMFSPYFNHPLGIAFFLLWALSLETLGEPYAD